MKTLADFKRRLVPGTVLETVRYRDNTTHQRTVKEVRSRDVILLTPEQQESYFSLGKASDWEFSENEATQYNASRQKLITIRFNRLS